MCFVWVNQNAWANDTIIKEWFYKVWIKYIKEEQNLCDNIGYLILDKATSRITPSALEIFKNNLFIFFTSRFVSFYSTT